jgi:hypothetical protein
MIFYLHLGTVVFWLVRSPLVHNDARPSLVVVRDKRLHVVVVLWQ